MTETCSCGLIKQSKVGSTVRDGVDYCNACQKPRIGERYSVGAVEEPPNLPKTTLDAGMSLVDRALAKARSVETSSNVVKNIGVAIIVLAIAVGALVALTSVSTTDAIDGTVSSSYPGVSFGLAIAGTGIVQGLLLVLLGGYANMRSLVVQADLVSRRHAR